LGQRDSLSPFLFILGSEVFSRLSFKEERKVSIKGLRIARNCAPIHHLLFADDLLLFGKASLKLLVLSLALISIADGLVSLLMPLSPPSVSAKTPTLPSLMLSSTFFLIFLTLPNHSILVYLSFWGTLKSFSRYYRQGS
jgi:hypothetical protein